MPCNGIIRLAFKEADIDPDACNYEDYKKVFNNFLKERLEKIGIDNAADVVEYIISELVNNQAVFTMAS